MLPAGATELAAKARTARDAGVLLRGEIEGHGYKAVQLQG